MGAFFIFYFTRFRFFLFNLKELLTTETELNDIANAAIIGFNNPMAANGIPIML
jgi:hypothetical protein